MDIPNEQTALELSTVEVTEVEHHAEPTITEPTLNFNDLFGNEVTPISTPSTELPTTAEPEPTAETKKREYTPPKETVKQIRATSKVTAQTFSWLLNYIFPNFLSSISGADPQKYKMTDKDRAEYDELASYYFESTGNLPSPSLMFYLVTGFFLVGGTIKAFQDRKEVAAEKERSQDTAKAKRILRKTGIEETAAPEAVSTETPIKKPTAAKKGRPRKNVKLEI